MARDSRRRKKDRAAVKAYLGGVIDERKLTPEQLAERNRQMPARNIGLVDVRLPNEKPDRAFDVPTAGHPLRWVASLVGGSIGLGAGARWIGELPPGPSFIASAFVVVLFLWTMRTRTITFLLASALVGLTFLVAAPISLPMSLSRLADACEEIRKDTPPGSEPTWLAGRCADGTIRDLGKLLGIFDGPSPLELTVLGGLILLFAGLLIFVLKRQRS